LFVDEMGDRIDRPAAHAAFDGVVDTHQPDWRRARRSSST
jgi:hypothetical protein